MQDALLCGKILSVKDGFIVCPVCRKKMHGIRVTSRSQAANIQIKCETCKNAYSLIIDSGRCFDSQRPV